MVSNSDRIQRRPLNYNYYHDLQSDMEDDALYSELQTISEQMGLLRNGEFPAVATLLAAIVELRRRDPTAHPRAIDRFRANAALHGGGGNARKKTAKRRISLRKLQKKRFQTRITSRQNRNGKIPKMHRKKKGTRGNKYKKNKSGTGTTRTKKR